MEDTIVAPGGATPKLNAALARFQAQVPKITKDEKATIPGREGRAGFGYAYAGLDAITDAALPLLGKHGLAFTAWPTLIDGKFVLLYELLHESGEQKSGIFPLASSGKPQELGGLITYYRRYALCAVTGIAPGGEDDDAQSSNNPQQFDRLRGGAEAFENATPAPPRQRPDEGPAENPWVTEHLTLVAECPTEEAGRALWHKVAAAAKERDISRSEAKRLQDLITARIADLRKAADPLTVYGLRPEDDWASKVASIADEADADAATADVGQQMKSGAMTAERAEKVAAAIDARLAELAAKAAA
jgi:hypothetical protein